VQLRKLKCQYGQGYLFSRPVDAESAGVWISKRPQWQTSLFASSDFVPAHATVVQLRSA
jgi:hypothetical protein